GTLPGNISYQAMYGHVDIAADGGLADGMETLNGGALGPMDTTSTDTDYAYAGKIQWDAPFGLKLAASLYTLRGLKMDMNSTTYLPAAPPLPVGLPLSTSLALDFDPIESYVLSVEYVVDRLTLMAEYVENDMGFTADITTNLDPVVSALMGVPSRLGDKTTTQGYYGGASYRVLDQMEIGAYYSELYYDKSDHDGEKYAVKFSVPKHNAWLKDACLSVRYDISDNWCAKAEAHLMDGAFMASHADAKDWELYAAKLTYSF
ncbi:MAG: hypothetical protein ACOZBW_00505, partial [Thermodesulfobacteriota bacterium]